MTYPSFLIEKHYWENNQFVIGLDEAGRGCLAGPVYAAAVIFPLNFDMENQIKNYFSDLLINSDSSAGIASRHNKSFNLYNKFIENPKLLINDSKVLDALTREIAYDFIVQKAKSFSITSVDAGIIDEINILQASQLAFRQALEKLKIKNEHILVDGNYFKKFKDLTFETVVKGDSKSISIAAASILAKVSRDSYLKSVLHKKYSNYGFDHHFGYATKEHFEAIEQFGETEFHRKTFLKKYFNRKKEFQQQELF